MPRTAGDLLVSIKQMCAMDIEELGADANQTTALLAYLSQAMKYLAHLAYVTRISETLTITEDGYKTFRLSNQPITDLYSPLKLLDATGFETIKRTSFSGYKGWFRESANQQIHTRDLLGDFTLYYVAYPASVTAVGDSPEFPESGDWGLIYFVCGLIKESRNAYSESQAMYDRAKQHLKVAVLANEASRGYSSGGYVPSVADVDRIFKG